MIEINLLPWRTTLREQNKKKRRFFLSGFIGLSLGICGITHMTMNHFLQKTQTRIQHLQKQLDHLVRKPDDNDSAEISRLIKRIRLNQIELIHFFNAISVPGMSWQAIDSLNGRVLLAGKADSFRGLLHFVEHSQARMISMAQAAYTGALEFRLQYSRAKSMADHREK